MGKTDREELAEAVAELRAVKDVPPEARRYVEVVIAEAERDLRSTAMGPRRGRSIFELHGGVSRACPELLESESTYDALQAVNHVNRLLPDYFPWRFSPQSFAETPIADGNGVVRGEETRRWGAGSWRLRLIEQPLDDEIFNPFLAPLLDTLSPDGWWLIERRERIASWMAPDNSRLIAGKTGEYGLLKVSAGNKEVSDFLNPLNPGFNETVHLLAVSGSARPGLGAALVAMIDDALSGTPDLTVAEAVLHEIWQFPSKELAAHFEDGRFFVAASTGDAEGLLWLTEGAHG